MIDYKVSAIYILIVKALWILSMKGCIIFCGVTADEIKINYLLTQIILPKDLEY